MTTVERTGEVLARRLDRSAFVRKSAATIFGFTAAAAVQGLFPSRALAASCTYHSTVCACQPPNGTFCTSRGYNCLNDGECQDPRCTFDTQFYPNACWCTQTCCYECGHLGAYCGYYNCCDCYCGGTACGCRASIYTCNCTGAPEDCVLCC